MANGVVILAAGIIISVIIGGYFYFQNKNGEDQVYQVTKEYYNSQGCQPSQIENGKVVLEESEL